MKNNKHPHHDLIVEWAKDTSKEIQEVCATEGLPEVWIDEVVFDSKGEREFQIKPREFQKGHWYPCVDIHGNNGVILFNGRVFENDYVDDVYQESSMKWIGESLGKIKFGGEE